MLHKAWNSKGEMPYCFPRSSIKFQGHTIQNITDFDPNWAFPDYRPVAAFKSIRFALLIMGAQITLWCNPGINCNVKWNDVLVPKGAEILIHGSVFYHSNQVISFPVINSEGTLIYTPNTCDSPMGSINCLRSNNLDAVDVCNFSNNWNNPWNITLQAYNDVITSRAFPHHWLFVRLIRRWPGFPSQSVSNVICRIFVLVAGQAAEQTVVWPVVWDALVPVT